MTLATRQPSPPLVAAPPAQTVVVGGAVVLAAALGLHLALGQGARMALLYLTGILLGLALYYASFGFTAAFRVMISDRRSAGIRAQMLMFALACLLFFPALAAGTVFGQPVGGFVFGIGPGVVLGSFMFGIGMQLGGGCGSGTLFPTGGGNARMLLTLIFFIVGSMLGFAHLPWWESQASLPALSLVNLLGWVPALALNLAVFAAIYFASRALELRRHGKVQPISGWRASETQRPFLARHWPMLAGGVALAVLNFATLLLAGRPWGITAAFPLWGATALQALGIDVAQWPSWSDPFYRDWLAAGVLGDATSVMDIGLMLGAAAAAGLSGEFRPTLRIPIRQIAASIIGGLLMGYGARIAYGCNIGAYFGGIASGSLHGWAWIVFALAGNWLGTWLRPSFGMAVERTAPAASC